MEPKMLLSAEQDGKVTNLLAHGGGVSLAQIQKAAEVKPDVVSAADLEEWLLYKIAIGQVRRVWNSDAKSHFYMARD